MSIQEGLKQHICLRPLQSLFGRRFGGACEGSLACSTCHVIVMDVEHIQESDHLSTTRPPEHHHSTNTRENHHHHRPFKRPPPLPWEKYESEEEAALGRGKRQRKVVSYREAYAPRPIETLESLRCKESKYKNQEMILLNWLFQDEVLFQALARNFSDIVLRKEDHHIALGWCILARCLIEYDVTMSRFSTTGKQVADGVRGGRCTAAAPCGGGLCRNTFAKGKNPTSRYFIKAGKGAIFP